jgi:hypothetical protein
LFYGTQLKALFLQAGCKTSNQTKQDLPSTLDGALEFTIHLRVYKTNFSSAFANAIFGRDAPSLLWLLVN